MIFQGLALARVYKTNTKTDFKDINTSKLIYIEIHKDKLVRYLDHKTTENYKPFCANNSWILKDEIIQIIEPKLDYLKAEYELDHLIINIPENLKI